MQQQRPVNRVEPNMPVQNYQTYQVAAPLGTHFRRATCAEVECEGIRLGWTTSVDETSELGQRQAYFIRVQAGRQFTETRADGGITVFTFPAGQPCFARDSHRVRNDQPELYVVRDGDWRGNPTRRRRRLRADQWLDDFATHQDALKTRLERG